MPTVEEQWINRPSQLANPARTGGRRQGGRREENYFSKSRIFREANQSVTIHSQWTNQSCLERDQFMLN